MSFLKIGDRAAGAIKSGGTTRRAAKMVIVDIDHPDIEHFIDWKVIEEQKVAALVAGSKLAEQHLNAVMKACINCEGSGDDCFDPQEEPRAAARGEGRAQGDDSRTTTSSARSPSPSRATAQIDFRTYDTDWDFGSLSLRLRPELEQHGARDGRIPARRRRRRRLELTLSPRRQHRQDAEGARVVGQDLARGVVLRRSRHPVPLHASTIGTPARQAADPRLQPVLGIHVPGRHGLQSRLAEPDGVPQRQRGLASIGKLFDVAGFEHAVRLWTIVLEISVMMAQFPSREIAQLSYDYRTLGLGFANIGGLLMAAGIPYDSREGRAIAAAISAVMTGVLLRDQLPRWRASSAPFPEYAANRDAHAARHPQPSPRRPWRRRRLRAVSPPCPFRSTTPPSTQEELSPRPQARLGRRARDWARNSASAMRRRP